MAMPNSKAAAELQALHLSAFTRLRRPELARLPRAATGMRPPQRRPVYFGTAGGTLEAQIFDRTALAPGFKETGPALIEEYGSTTLVWPGDSFDDRHARAKSASSAGEAEPMQQDSAQASAAVDPITLEVIRHRLVSITNQIDANIKRTAFSPYIYEYNDFAVGLTGAHGQLVAQCTGGMPPFVADSVGHGGARRACDLRGGRGCITATWWCAITPRCRASISTTR